MPKLNTIVPRLVLEIYLSHVARMVKNFETSEVNLDRDVDGSSKYKLQNASETNKQHEGGNLTTLLNPAEIDNCSLTISEEEDKDGESEYLNPNMNHSKSFSSESGIFQLTIKISLVSILLLSVLLLVVIFSIPTPYDHGADSVQQDLGSNHVEKNQLYLVNAKFRSIIFKHFPSI